MQQRRIYRQVPNFNLLPAEYQRATTSVRRLSIRVLLGLVIVVELFLLWNLYQEKPTIEASIDSTQQQLRQIEQKVAIVNDIKALESGRPVLVNDWKGLTLKQADWAQVMAALVQSRPQGVELALVKRDGMQVIVTGTASDYATLNKYRSALLSSSAISQIIFLNSAQVEPSISFSLAVEVKIEGNDA